jgi:hypothetical protein
MFHEIENSGLLSEDEIISIAHQAFEEECPDRAGWRSPLV